MKQRYTIDEITDDLHPPYLVVRQANVEGDPVVGQLVPDDTIPDGDLYVSAIPELVEPYVHSDISLLQMLVDDGSLVKVERGDP